MSILSVTQLNKYISEQLSNDYILSNVTVTGEISNFTDHYSGHLYFSIKDETSTLKCFMSSTYKKYLNTELKDGLKVTLKGFINVYEKGGYYSLFVKSCIVEGAGDLDKAFREMYERLSKEGLFDKEHKKPIPLFPTKIGVVTSSTGAAVNDITRIIENKNDVCKIIIFPVQVQGEGAALDISNMIDYINRTYDDIDMLIVGRGGGSKEDLWAFNEEVLAYSIYNSKIPIVSAVGHEIDFSISDFVADFRAETPTAAAELLPNTFELRENILKIKNGLLNDLKKKIDYDKLVVDGIYKEIKDTLLYKIKDYESRLSSIKIALTDNNPRKVLDKGYSILKDKDNLVISSTKDLNDKDRYKLILKDGEINFSFNNIERK